MDIDDLIDAAIGREGGFSDHPADRGGATRWGITERVARANGYAGDMRALPRATAAGIYRRLYWEAPGYDRGQGGVQPRGFLQRALNALNRGGTDYPDIAIDGRIGPRTLAALAGFRARRGAAGERVLLKALEALQGARYLTLAERRPANEAFLYGWLANRLG